MKLQINLNLRTSNLNRLNRMSLLRAGLLSVFCATTVQGARADWQQTESIIEGSISPGDQFGSSVYLTGDSIFVAAKSRGNGEGEVFIRKIASGGDVSMTSLKPPVDQDHSNSFFGHVMLVHEGSLLVSAHQRNFPGTPPVGNAGAVQVYTKSSTGSWELAQTLSASDPGKTDQFGSEVVADGSTLAISAPRRDSQNLRDSGAVYIFEKSSTGQWVEKQIIESPQPVAGDQFGNVLALEGGQLLIGAHLADGAAFDEGRVFVYGSGSGAAGWTLSQTLQAPTPAAGAKFGFSLDMQGDLAVIGAPREDVNGVASGAAHVFKSGPGGWVSQGRVAPETPKIDVEFGSHVGLSSDQKLLAVGAPADSSAGLFAGAVYLFSNTNSSWTEQETLVSPRPKMFDEFGGSFSLSGNRLLVGVRNDNTVGSQAGAAYLFESESGGPTPAPLGSLFGLSLLGGGLLAMRRRQGTKR